MERVDAAVKVAEEAGKLLVKYQGNLKEITYKDGRSMVTEADFASEKLIIDYLKKFFPSDCILAEESGLQGSSDGQWIIDPLDGTTNYVYGMPWFGINIAYVKENVPRLSVIHLPILQQTFVAICGKGAACNGKQIRVSERKKLDEALLLFDSSFNRGKNKLLKNLRDVVDHVYRVRMFGVACLQFASVAQGYADVYIEHTTTPWDITAGALLVEEAGGNVTTFSGKPWSPNSSSYIASNGLVHNQVKEMLQ